MATAASEADFQQTVIERSHERPVVVDFWADWCGPCHRLAPIIEQAVDETAGAVELVKVDVDANATLAAEYSVRGIPAVKAFRDGRVVDEFVGVLPHAQIAEFLAGLTGPSPREQLVAELRDAGREEALAAVEAGDDERALELLLAEAGEADDETRERVRELMLQLFAALGTEHPLTLKYRRRLAALLF